MPADVAAQLPISPGCSSVQTLIGLAAYALTNAAVGCVAAGDLTAAGMLVVLMGGRQRRAIAATALI